MRRGVVRSHRDRSPEHRERLIVIEIAGEIERAKPQFVAGLQRSMGGGRTEALHGIPVRTVSVTDECWQSPVHKTMIDRCPHRSGRFGTRRKARCREGDRRKKQSDVLLKSAELIGWAIGGIEREIAQTRERLAALTAQAAQAPQARGSQGMASSRRRRECPVGCRRGASAGTPQDVAGSAQEDLGNDEEAMGGAAQGEVSLQHESAAEAALRSFDVGKVRGRDILDRHPQRFEDRHLARQTSCPRRSRGRPLPALPRCAARRTRPPSSE